MLGHATQWGQVKRKGVKDKEKVVKSQSWTESPPSSGRGRGKAAPERGFDRGSRGRGGNSKVTKEANELDGGRGTRGRGRGEGTGRGRGRGGFSTTIDPPTSSAGFPSDETPVAWGDEEPSFDDTAVADTEPKNVNGVNGSSHKDESASAQTSVWGKPIAAPVETVQPVAETPILPQKVPPTSSTPTRQSRVIDPTSKMSWASIVKPPPPPPKPVPPPPQPVAAPISAPPPYQASLSSSRPSTKGQDILEEPAQTIHDPFAASEPSKPKVQLPLPYIPPIIATPKEKQLPASDPLTSRNLDILEDQQTAVPEPPSGSVSAHQGSPGSKTEGPPGLNTRFARTSRDNPVIMPELASQSLSGVQLQFGSIDLNTDSDAKVEESTEEPIRQAQELQAPQQPTPSQPQASPAAAPQPAAQPQSQRIPSAQPASQTSEYQQPPFGGLIPGQAQRYTGGPAPGLSQQKDFVGGFPYDQQYQSQAGAGYGDYLYSAGGQGQYEMGPRDYYNYYQQRGPPSSESQRGPANPTGTPSASEATTPSQFTTPGTTSTQPTPTPSAHGQHQHHQYPSGVHPYWQANPYYNQMYQPHYGGYPYYNQGHKGMYQGQGYGGSQYGNQPGGYDRFSGRGDHGGDYNSFGRMNYGGGSQTGQPSIQGQGAQQHGGQQGSQAQDDQTSEAKTAPTPQASQQGAPGRLQYGLDGQSGPSSQQGYQQQQQHHYAPQQQHGYGGYNQGYNQQQAPPTQPSTQQPSQTGGNQGSRNQGQGWSQRYGSGF